MSLDAGGRMPRRRAAPVLVLVALLAIAGGFTTARAAADAPARLARSLDRMERLRGVTFTMTAAAAASGPDAAGGRLETSVRARGRVAPPDRLALTIETPGATQELIVIGERTWSDEGAGFHQSVRLAKGPLRSATAPLEFVRGPGVARFAGFGILGGVPTYRVRIDLDAASLAARLFADEDVDPESRGVIEIELGLFDDLVHRQIVEISEPADPFGHGLDRLVTRYQVDYADFDRPVDVREPD